MKIVLVSAIFSDLGISTLAPLLKKDGHNIKLLFIPQLLQEGLFRLSQKTISNVIDFIGDADMVGVNSFSENHSRITRLVDDVKKTTRALLVWGGIHATLQPEDCLAHSDIVCLGEGEKALLELTRRLRNGDKLDGIKNLLFRSGPNNRKNIELYPLVGLNELLPLDYDLNTQYIMEDGRIRNVHESDFNGVFNTYSSRGCPFKCSYCCSSVIHDLYKEERFCRQRNIDKVISDLKKIKERFSSCRHIWFNEADFIVGKTQKDIERFAAEYKTEIGIPFSIWSNPAAVNHDCIKILKDTGLVTINIGTINGSERIQRLIYKRNASAKLYMEKATILTTYGIKVQYDFILCNPYENEDDIISTIKLLMELPKPFEIIIYALTYFPKTELYEMALKDGKIEDKQLTWGYSKAAYKVWKFSNNNTYLNIVASMMRGLVRRSEGLKMNFYGVLPEPVLRFLISKRAIRASSYMPFSRYAYTMIGNLIMVTYITALKISSLRKRLVACLFHIK